jgi:signal transduction histidine kinase
MDVREFDRLRREMALRKRLQEALLVFSRGLAARSSVETALEGLARDITWLVGARAASVWLHDREARTLVLAASSRGADTGTRASFSTAEDVPLVSALRRDSPELSGRADRQSLAVPLRGWRRALGVLVVDGEPSELTTDQFVAVVGDLAPQLSALLENIVVVEEIIRRHAAEKELQARLQPVEKLAAVGQFVAGIAHELNNPLQAALLHVDLLTTTAGDEVLKTELRRLYGDVDRAAKIVRNLLVYTGSRKPARRPVDVPAIIKDAIAMRREIAQAASIEFMHVCEESVPPLIGDPALLEQAFLNVLLNAEQAIIESAGSGKVIVRVASVDGAVRVEVDDTGRGIDPEIVSRIFEPFFTTKELGKGTGLGLAITRRIVTEHGGRIAADPSPHGGARFTIELPFDGSIPDR